MIGVPRRLSKYLCEATSLGLEDAKAACMAGRVEVVADGRLARTTSTSVFVFDEDTVLLDGAPIRPRSAQYHVMLHKPAGVVSTASAPDGQRDLAEWLAQWPPGTAPVGRLDRDTTGLLLCTTDGDLSDAITRPDQHLPKRYWLWLDEVVGAEDPRLLALVQGVPCRSETLRADTAQIVAQNTEFTELELTLTQGRKRQIRRMCRGVRLRLVHLHRLGIGPLELGDLEPGQYRCLERAEVDALWSAVGGHARQRELRVEALRLYAVRARSMGAPNSRIEAWLRTRPGHPWSL